MAMTSFRRSAIHNSASKPRSGGGGAWYDKFRLPQNNQTPFVLINAEYVDPNPPQELIEFGPTGQPLPVKNAYFKFRKHKRKSMKYGKEWYSEEVCSQGNDPHNPQPCAGCIAMDRGDKTVTSQDMFAFGMVHLHPYHRHPLWDVKNKNFRMKGDNSGPIFSFTECEGRTCNFCNLLTGKPPVLAKDETFPPYNPNDIKTEFGHRRYLEVGKGHLSNLEGWEGAVTSQCSSHIVNEHGKLLARCSQQLIQESYNCPTCGSTVIDLANDPRDDAQIDAAVSRPYPCLKCQRPVMLKQVVSCDSCTQDGRNFQQLGLFDVVLWGKRQGEGTKSQMMLHQFQTIEEFQKSLPPHMVQMLNGKSVSDIIKELGTPYEFGKIFEPKSLEEQAKRLDLAPEAPQQQSLYNQPVFNPNTTWQGAPEASAGAPAFMPYTANVPPPPAGAQVLPGPHGFQPPVKPNFGK